MARRASRTVIDGRVARIAELMARGQWLSRASAIQLAKEWKIAPRTVRDYSKQASRLLWNDAEDLQELRTTTILKLELLAAKAESKGELRTAVAALQVLADVSGAKAAQRLEHTGAGGAPLSPVLIALQQSAPGLTVDEYEHYAQVGSDAGRCELAECRVHGRRLLGPS